MTNKNVAKKHETWLFYFVIFIVGIVKRVILPLSRQRQCRQLDFFWSYYEIYYYRFINYFINQCACR